MTILDKVKAGEIKFCCPACAKQHRVNKPYNGIYTMHIGVCQICKEKTSIGSAKKLFGEYEGLM